MGISPDTGRAEPTVYTWTAVPHDITQVPVALGICDDLEDAKDAVTPYVTSGRALAGIIRTVAVAMGTATLIRSYVPAGHAYLGRRTTDGAIRWETLDLMTSMDFFRNLQSCAKC
jgi:hypothetical protein